MKTLKKGASGEEVIILQHLLNYRGANLKTDGDFGTKTKNAVLDFQRNSFDERGHALNPDGVVGPSTWHALVSSDQPAPATQIPPADPITLTRIDQIHPVLREELHTIYKEIRERGVGVRFTDVLRTFAQQDALYARGRTVAGDIVTKARAGQSYHNYGLAVDIVLLLPNGQVSWDRTLDFDKDGTRDWDEIVFVFKHYGWKWGGDWTSFKDYPHFEKTFGLTTAELMRRYEHGEFVDQKYVTL